MSNDLGELADRVERAHGRDPWLSRDIEVALGLGRNCDNSTRQNDAYAMPLHRHDYYVPPSYTSSVDAAILLMPTHAVWSVTGPVSGIYQAKVQTEAADPLPTLSEPSYGHGQNPALALTAACLRARTQDPVQ